MELLPITLAANETKQFAKAGRYFEIITADFPLAVQFTGDKGAQTDQLQGAVSGLFIEDPYSHFAITNGPNAQTIVLLLMETGRGGSRRQPGTVDVTNKIGSNVQLVNVGLSSVFGFNVGATALLPASNLKGARIRNAQATATGGTGNAQTTIIAAPATPVVPNPTNAIWLASAFTPNTGTVNDSRFEMNLTIPPGWGIYLCTAHGGASGAVAGAQVAFELIQ